PQTDQPAARGDTTQPHRNVERALHELRHDTLSIRTDFELALECDDLGPLLRRLPGDDPGHMRAVAEFIRQRCLPVFIDFLIACRDVQRRFNVRVWQTPFAPRRRINHLYKTPMQVLNLLAIQGVMRIIRPCPEMRMIRVDTRVDHRPYDVAS